MDHDQRDSQTVLFREKCNSTCLNRWLLVLIAALAVLALTFVTLIEPLIFLTGILFLSLFILLIVQSRTGIIFLALSFPLLPKTYTAISGDLFPFLFYAAFIIGFLAIIYGGVIGIRIKIPSLMLDKYLLIFTVYLLFSFIFVSNEQFYGFEKFRYFMMNVVLFYLIVLLVKKEDDLEDIFRALLYYSIFFTLYSLLSFLDMEPFYGNTWTYTGRFSSMGLNPIMMARYFSYAILIELYFLFKYLPQWHKHMGKIALLCLMIPFQLYLALLTGSRGPIMAMLVGILFLVIFNLRASIKIGHVIAIIAVVIIALIVAISFLPSYIAERLLLSEQGGQTTALIRIWLNIEAVSMFWEHKLLGSGLGGFSIFDLKYPHNIITEVLSEMGLIGFTLLLIIFGLTIKYLLSIKNRIHKLKYYFIFTMLVASFINANLSGHIGGNFFFFFSLGLVYAARESRAETKLYNTDSEENKC